MLIDLVLCSVAIDYSKQATASTDYASVFDSVLTLRRTAIQLARAITTLLRYASLTQN